MAGYDNKANIGYGQVTDHVRLPMFFDKEGRQHAVVGYAKTQNYMAKSTEQFVEFRNFPGIGRMEPYEGLGIRDKPILMPLAPLVHDQPHKDKGFSTEVHNHVGHGETMGSPWKRNANEPYRLAVHDQSKGLPRNWEASDPSQFPIHDQSKGSSRHWDASDPSHFAVHDQSKGLPRNRDASNPSRLAIHGPSKDSPRSKDAYKSSQFMSPPSKDHYYNTHEHGKNNQFSDDEDDVICEGGVCFVNKKGGSKPSNHLKQEDYDRGKHRGNDHAPGKDSYHEASSDNNEKQRGNGYAPKRGSYYETSYDNDGEHKGTGHIPSYTVPITTPPRVDTYYEPPPHNKNRPMVHGPNPIETKPGAKFSKENKQNSPVSIGVRPQYNGSPRKDHGYEDTNYKASPPAGRPGTIDSREAARRYNGVLLTN